MKTLFSLFAGGGLFTEGAKQAGFMPVGGIELDPEVANLYNRNNNIPLTIADIRKVDFSQFSEGVDLLQASPPCTRYSGVNQLSEGDLDLEFSDAILRATLEMQARFLLIENVPSYLASKALEKLAQVLSVVGYSQNQKVLTASDYGDPQRRKRAFVLFSKEGIKLPAKPKQLDHCWYRSIVDLLPSLPSDTLAEYQNLALARKKELLMHSPALLVERVGANTKNPQIIPAGNPSMTIRASRHTRSPYAPNIVTDPYGENTIVMRSSARVMARWQGLPDTYELSDTRADYTAIGNGVSVGVAKAICRGLLKAEP